MQIGREKQVTDWQSEAEYRLTERNRLQTDRDKKKITYYLRESDYRLAKRNRLQTDRKKQITDWQRETD